MTEESSDEHLGRLDDEDFRSVTMGQAAELLGVQPAFLRSLDIAGVLHPHRTSDALRQQADDALEDARADLRDRDAELRRTRAELHAARRQITDLRRREGS